MKLCWVFLFGVGIVLLTMAVALVVALFFDDREPWTLVTTFVCTMLLVTAPAIACLTVANLSFDLGDSAGRRVLKRLVLVIAGIQLLSVVGLAFVAVRVRESIGYLVGVVALSVALLLGAIRLGTLIQRRLVGEPAEHRAWSPWSRFIIRGKFLRVVTVFAIASVIGSGTVVGLGFVLGDGEDLSLGFAVIYGLSIGSISSSVACLVLAWPLVKDLRRVLGRDYATQKAIARVVLRNKNDDLSEDGQHRAATYAGIMAVYYPFQIAQLAFLFGGIWLQQIWNLTDGSSDRFFLLTMGLVVGIPLLLIVLLPFPLREARRAKHYSAEHADLITANATDPDENRTATRSAADRPYAQLNETASNDISGRPPGRGR